MTTETRSQATATAVLADGDAASTENRTIHGVAISDDEVTNGLHGKKKWVPEELEKAAGTLQGETVTAAPDVGGLEVEGALVETNHGERVAVGDITDSAYEDGIGVVYEMDVRNEDIYSALALGELDISIEASNPSDVEEDEETGALIMRDYVFDGMDVVEKGAARSNHTAAGPASNNAAIAALSAQDVDDMLDEQAESDAEDDGDDDDAALASSSVHSPTYSGTSTSSPSWAEGSWERPSKSQFDDDDLSDIGQHFIASTSGFQSPDSYSDLKLPVVEPNGDLNLNGLKAANSRASQTSGLSDDDKSTAKSKIQNLASEEFDEDLGGEEAANEAQEQAAASEGDEQDRDLADIESGEDTGLDDVETESAPDTDQDQDQEASAGDTDDPSEGEVSADAGSAADDDEDSQTADGGANNDSGTAVKSESDANETEAEDEASDEAEDESDSPSDSDEDVAEDDDPETPESTSGPESSDDVEDGNGDEDAETDAEGGSDDAGAVSSASEANETESTMADTTPEDDEESTDNENQTQNTPEEENEGGQQAGLNLDGQVVIDEDRHDELKTKAAMAEDLEEENSDLKRDLKEREEQIDTVHSVYSAALAEAGPHSEEFYQEMPLETLRDELANTQGVEDDQAALEEAVTNDQPLPQTGDQSAGEGASEAALEEADENAEAALRLDDMAALAQSDQSPRDFVQDRHGVDPTEFDDDIELRDAIYGDNAAAAGGDA